tara:strand:- start:366 stop:617 length:252 start_codon:yes stop_codon:yes gene_type:complete
METLLNGAPIGMVSIQLALEPILSVRHLEVAEFSVVEVFLILGSDCVPPVEAAIHPPIGVRAAALVFGSLIKESANRIWLYLS